MRFIYYYGGSVNGENAIGHYIRSLIEVGGCTSRSSVPIPGCGATFGIPGTGAPVHVARDISASTARAARARAVKMARDARLGGSSTTTSGSGAPSTTGPYTSSKALLDYLLAP
jgi:hypothetical protein